MTSILTAIGSQFDCEALLNNFVASDGGSFAEFASEYKRMHFSMIFAGREPGTELGEFTRELLHIAKSFLFSAKELKKKVGCIYLLYSLYYKQSVGAKIRFTNSELVSLFASLQEMKRENFLEAEFIFYKLYLSGAFHFTATTSPHIHQTNLNGDSVFDYQGEAGSELFKLLDNEQGGRLEQLDSKYEEMKASIHISDSSSEASIESGFIDTIRDQLSQLKRNTEKGRGVKRAKYSIEEESSSDSEDSSDEYDEQENAATRRQCLLAKSFQNTTGNYRMPGSSRGVWRGSKLSRHPQPSAKTCKSATQSLRKTSR